MAAPSLQSIDDTRRLASSQLDPTRRASFGQFMTPSPIAGFMAAMFQHWPSQIRLLDPGAGIGSLTDAFVTRALERAPSGTRLDMTAYEIEPILVDYLADHMAELEGRIRHAGRDVKSTIVQRDFIAEGTFASAFGAQRYTHAILNPPYAKIGSFSEHRKLLRGVGIETVNLYSAFMALAVGLTEIGGEIVAIVPRSFCNGTYFRPFREWLLDRVALTHVHVFESRKRAFKDDDVLQENIILHLVRGGAQGAVTISTSHDASFADYTHRSVPFTEIVKPSDKERFIHIPTGEPTKPSALFSCTLADLGIDVATGPVVDFRLREFWLAEPTETAAPLLYAHHFAGGTFQWPREHKKPNALEIQAETLKWFMPRGWYVVTKRFSSKEERRRIVAYTLDPAQLPYDLYGFENHLNVIHFRKSGLDENLARGLALFLNSTVVDTYFRTFSGHTQVNATDLRNMHFPSRPILIQFGKWACKQAALSQEQIDTFIESHHGQQ